MQSRLLLFILLFFHLSCSTTQRGEDADRPIRIAFYNVENLFDLEDDPATLDEDFTPTGKQEWTQERYQTKLSRIHEVVKGMHYPALLGLSEIENSKVLADLSETGGMAAKGYQFAHFDSPDKRGIDVALLYQKKLFKVKNSSYLRLDFPLKVIPDEPGYTSRDILIVEGEISKKSTVYVFVVHWPSRRGGLVKSEPKRVFVASQVRNKIDELAQLNPDAQFIVMGDFNDETTNKSVARTLEAYPLPTTPNRTRLYNCFSKLDKENQGSYNYRGDWNMLDQIILSGHFFEAENALKFRSANIFKEEFLLYQDEKHGARPNRTYGGPNYYGGYSDHLPVFIELDAN